MPSRAVGIEGPWKIVFVKLDTRQNKKESQKINTQKVQNEFDERRPPRSGGWRVSRRLSRVKTSSASGACRAAAAGG